MPIYLQHGNLIDYVPPTDTSTEDVVFMGGLVGIPQTFIPAGELGALSVDGVYIFNKKDGVAVNLGDVVKYCGTTKFAQDSNADLTLGVAVADADADDFGVKVKINSVLPTDGGCGGGGEVAIDTSRGLSETSSGVGINIGSGLSFGSCGELNATGGGGGGGGEIAVSCGLAFNDDGELAVEVATSCGLNFDMDGKLIVSVAYGCGISFNSYGELVATGGGEDALCGDSGLYLANGEVAIKYCSCSAIRADEDGVYLNICSKGGLRNTPRGLEVNIGNETAGVQGLGFCSSGELYVTIGEGFSYDCGGAICLNVCNSSGLAIIDGYLTYTG